jgi:hypothetical protein
MNVLRLIRKSPSPAESENGPMDELFDLIRIREDGMAELIADKLTEQYTLRIPECTDKRLRRLSGPQKKALNEQILIVIAKYLHDADFDPSRYLSDEYDTRNGCAR